MRPLTLFLQIQAEASKPYERPVMTNIHRSDYVEAIVSVALMQHGWRRMTPWDSLGWRERVAGMPTAPLAFRRSPFGSVGGQDESAVDSASPIPIGRHPGSGRLRPVLFGRPVPL